jgi:hypothetical protein
MTEKSDPTADSELVDLVHERFKEARDHASAWREDAREAYDMAAGAQWSEEDLAILKDQKRPAVVFNRIARTVNAVIGTQVSNRQETRFIPREMGDVQVNEILTAANEWARDASNAEDEESEAFEDMCVTGIGWTETAISYAEDPEGMIRIDRVDPLEMFWDPGSAKRNLADARWVIRVRLFTQEEFDAEWPDADPQISASPWDGEEEDVTRRTYVFPQDAYKSNRALKGAGKARPRIRVAQFQWAEPKDVYRVGKSAEKIDKKKFEKLRPKLDKEGGKYIKQKEMVWKQAFIAGGTVLDRGECPFPHGPTFAAMTYKRDRNKNTWFGIVKAMIDPQRWGNKFFSQILDILNKGAKGGIMVEADAVDDFRQLEEKWATSDAVHKFRPGALAQGKIQPKPLVSFPSGLDKLMSFSMDAVHEVTGINLELLGFANREQAGVLETQRKQAGLTILAPLFDAMRLYRKNQGRVMLHFIREYISDGRLIRIVGKDGNAQYVALAKQPDSAKYDTIVDESPTSPNMKERVYGSLVDLMPAMLKAGMPLPPELLDYAPIPSSLAQKWKEFIRQSPQLPPEAQKQMEEGGKQIQKLQQENAALKDKRQEAQAELQMEQQKIAAEQQLEQEKFRFEIEKAKQEHELAIAKMQMEMEIEKQKMAADLELAGAKMQNDIALKRQESESKLALQEQDQTAQHAMKDKEIALQAKQCQDDAEAKDPDRRGARHKLEIEKMRLELETQHRREIDTRQREMREMEERRQRPPAKRRIVVNRGANGLIAGADIEEVAG